MDKHAALYSRVSTDAQYEEGYSIEAQKQMLEAYCVSKDIKNYENYIDGGYSGSNINRPELTRMISDINNGTVSHVVVYKLDRLSRSQKDTLYLIEDVLIPNGVSFVSLNENLDTSSPIGRAMLGIMSAFAQLERETIKERTRMGMKERVKNGLWPGGGKIPFGYDYDKEQGILVKNSDAETVKLMYDLYQRGWSMMRIARYTGLKYERLAEQIIKRKTNAGYIVYNGIEYKGKHEPIVSLETYENTMRLIEKRSGGSQNAKGLLAGLVICGVCGAKMRYQKWGSKGYKIYCYSQDKGKPHLHKTGKCDNVKVWAKEIEDTVINDLFSMAAGKVGNKDSTGEKKSITELYEKQKEKLSMKLRNLYSAFGDSDDIELMEVIETTKKELNIVKEKIEEEKIKKIRRSDEEELAKKLDCAEAAWDYMTFEEKRNILKSCIEKIVITYDVTDVYYKTAEPEA